MGEGRGGRGQKREEKIKTEVSHLLSHTCRDREMRRRGDCPPAPSSLCLCLSLCLCHLAPGAAMAVALEEDEAEVLLLLHDPGADSVAVEVLVQLLDRVPPQDLPHPLLVQHQHRPELRQLQGSQSEPRETEEREKERGRVGEGGREGERR
eukprot:2393767-Rhodomonas_salina.1